MVRALAFIALLVSAHIGLADDGYTSTTSGALNYGKNKQVQMVSERVLITLRDHDASIDATFHFTNHGPSIAVKMGFPDAADHGEVVEGFRSEVDGQPVKARRVVLSPPSADGDYFEGVWLKTVRFAPGQTRKVRVRYSAPNSFLESGTMWQEYILTTGATWAGPIEKCELVIDYSEVHSPYGILPQLDNAKGFRTAYDGPGAGLHSAVWRRLAPNRIATVLTNVKPDFNLCAHIIPGFWRFKINGKEVPVSDALYGMAGSWPILKGSEVLVNEFGANFLLGDEWDKEYKATGSKLPLPAFGREDNGIVKGGFQIPGGKLIPLPHKPVTLMAGYEKEPVEFVHLSDIVKGMGGAYRFDPKTRFVLIDFPKTRPLGSKD